LRGLDDYVRAGITILKWNKSSPYNQTAYQLFDKSVSSGNAEGYWRRGAMYNLGVCWTTL
jgi:hypothetical protein